MQNISADFYDIFERPLGVLIELAKATFKPASADMLILAKILKEFPLQGYSKEYSNICHWNRRFLPIGFLFFSEGFLRLFSFSHSPSDKNAFSSVNSVINEGHIFFFFQGSNSLPLFSFFFGARSGKMRGPPPLSIMALIHFNFWPCAEEKEKKLFVCARLASGTRPDTLYWVVHTVQQL